MQVTDDVASPRIVQGRGARAEALVGTQQDGVGCTGDRVFIERTSVRRVILCWGGPDRLAATKAP
jgi:hypothetical protein